MIIKNADYANCAVDKCSNSCIFTVLKLEFTGSVLGGKAHVIKR